MDQHNNNPSNQSIRSPDNIRSRKGGIRGKKTRIDIHVVQPENKQEIAKSKREQRLLRNRQAAHNSRQRKKESIERLKRDNEQFTIALRDMEQEVAELRAKLKQVTIVHQSCTEYIQTLEHEKEEMIRSHDIEAADLRKNVGVLPNDAQQLMNAGTNAFLGADDNKGGMLWDIFLNEYPIEPEVKSEMAMVY